MKLNIKSMIANSEDLLLCKNCIHSKPQVFLDESLLIEVNEALSICLLTADFVDNNTAKSCEHYQYDRPYLTDQILNWYRIL